jgi:DNA-directed RNA polymerase alpha subunit
MSIDFDRNVKFSEIFKELQGIDLTVEELDLSVRSCNFLKRAEIHSLQQLLSMSLDDLTIINDKRSYMEIIEKLRKLSDNKVHNADIETK